jgi:hypothetical protein
MTVPGLFRRTDGYSEQSPEPDGGIAVVDSTLLKPVQLTQVRVCHFKKKPCELCGKGKAHAMHSPKATATCKGKWPRGCLTCGRNKGDYAHFGAPPSFNVWSGQGSTGTMAYKGLKDQWQKLLLGLLLESPLGRMTRVYVEGEITFPDAKSDRDQGNFRVLIEKALGDALVEGGYIRDDGWDQYQFGQLLMRLEPGESATRLMLFPHGAPPALSEFHHEGEQVTLIPEPMFED